MAKHKINKNKINGGNHENQKIREKARFKQKNHRYNQQW